MLLYICTADLSQKRSRRVFYFFPFRFFPTVRYPASTQHPRPDQGPALCLPQMRPALVERDVRMKEIPLTQGQVALVDDEDFERVNAFKWHASWNPRAQSFYARRTRVVSDGWQTILMHRFILDTPNYLETDHINHNTLDNRRENLRNCTRAQNKINKRVYSNNKLGIKGISMDRSSYRVQIWAGKKLVFSKNFPTLEKAINARNKAYTKFHGKFACKE